jgi:NADP-reducing hydrogenase subunit HndC
MTPEEVIAEVKTSGLRGRGGAGFPTGLKWEFTRKAVLERRREEGSGMRDDSNTASAHPSSPISHPSSLIPYPSSGFVVCNGDEGDPGAFMDRSVLEGDPHSVIEGMALAGYATGSRQGYVYVRAEYPLAIERLTIALEQARERGFLGENLFGTSFGFDIEIRIGAGAFVCGEETALLASIEGRRGMPRPRPPFPAQSGLWGQPTLINNVETFANVPPILLHGGAWFARTGTEKSKGTKVFALAGDIANTGLVEVPLGIPLGEIIYGIGGGIRDGKAFKAAQIGGPSGGCIPQQYLDVPVDYESLTALGAIMGSGGLIVVDEDTCMVSLAAFFLDFLVDESCGKCIPCRVGVKKMRDLLRQIIAGEGQDGDVDRLLNLAQTVKQTSLCGLGQTAPNTVLSTIRHFREEYEAHIYEKGCPALACRDLVAYWIDPEVCVGCGLCRRKCPVAGVLGEQKAVHTIDQLVCTKCGTCFEVCPRKVQAVRKVTGREREALLRGE